MSKYEFCKTCSYWRDGVCKCPNNDIICSETPTVIEWIEKYVKETYPTSKNWRDYMVSFGELIDAWEKENGK